MSVLFPVLIALIFNGIDLLTGIIGAVKNKDLESTKLRDGVFKKVGFIVCYALAYLLDKFGADIGINISVKLLPIVVAYVVFTEVVSIIENIAKINPDLLPEKLMELFHINDAKPNTISDDDKTTK